MEHTSPVVMGRGTVPSQTGGAISYDRGPRPRAQLVGMQQVSPRLWQGHIDCPSGLIAATHPPSPHGIARSLHVAPKPATVRTERIFQEDSLVV